MRIHAQTHRAVFRFLFFLFLFPVAVHAQDPVVSASVVPPSVDLPPELDRVLREYEAAWSAGDEEALTALFAEDGAIRGDHGWIVGRDGIRARYESAGGPLRLRAVAYGVDGTAGYVVGAYGYGDEGPVHDRGVFILALRRASVDAPWMIAADLDNTIERE